MKKKTLITRNTNQDTYNLIDEDMVIVSKRTVIERLEKLKYAWDKPIDEMPDDWYQHNCAIGDCINVIKKL